MSINQELEVYADVACPFAHVSLRRFSDRRREQGLHKPVLIVRAWPLELVNDGPHSGGDLAPKIAALQAEVAPELFAGFDPDRFPTSSLAAMAATSAAYRSGPEHGEAFALAVRDALWEDGLDISDDGVLAELARELGVPHATTPDEEQVITEHAEGRQRGAEGSPHFFLGDDDFFCPTLEIDGTGTDMRVTTDRAALDSFASAVFG